MDNNLDSGLAVISKMLGSKYAKGFEKIIEKGGFGADSAAMAVEFAYGTVWSRPGLEKKERSLVTIGVLVASGQTSELKNHIRIAVANGLTVSELEEALIQTIPYVGFPRFASALGAASEMIGELGLDSENGPEK